MIILRKSPELENIHLVKINSIRFAKIKPAKYIYLAGVDQAGNSHYAGFRTNGIMPLAESRISSIIPRYASYFLYHSKFNKALGKYHQIGIGFLDADRKNYSVYSLQQLINEILSHDNLQLPAYQILLDIKKAYSKIDTIDFSSTFDS